MSGNNEIYMLLYNSAADWWYLSHQRPDETLLFKNFDSRLDIPAIRKSTTGEVQLSLHFSGSPHVAFDHSQQATGSPYRKSIEVRACVISHT
jgi:hypothetical protein